MPACDPGLPFWIVNFRAALGAPQFGAKYPSTTERLQWGIHMRSTSIVTALVLGIIGGATAAHAQSVPAAGAPVAVDKCFQLLDRQLSAADISRLRHGGWPLQYERRMEQIVSRECIEPPGLPLVGYFRALGIDHPEDMTWIVVTAYGRWLRQEQMGLDQMINARREHWRFLAERQKLPIVTLSSTDLMIPFHTRGNWRFVIRQDPPQEAALGIEPGNLHFCFVKGSVQSCFDSALNALASSKIEYLTPMSREPVLVVSVIDHVSMTGGGRETLIWAYNATTDQFDEIFDRIVNRNTNGEIRVITAGPLAGDVVVDAAGPGPSYRYLIEVYRLESPKIKRVLRYYGNSKYNDGTGLPVIDAEMAEIERRLHLWKPGDPLPTPARTNCGTLELRHGVEWCS